MIVRAWLFALTLPGSFVVGPPARAQGLLPVDPGTHLEKTLDSVPAWFDGLVLDPAGIPVTGALVTSSAGGRALTRSDGSYRLEIELPIGARRVELTARAAQGSDSPDASATMMVPVPPSGIVRVEPLVLISGTICRPSWLPTFGGQPGVEGRVRALTVFDDGGGPALYAGGTFLTAGGVAANRIARWDGSGWSPLGNGVNDEVLALAVFDDGNGAALYAGGRFRSAGGVAARYIAKWDGERWSALGRPDGAVDSLVVFDDGGGPALFAAGEFLKVDGRHVRRIGKWDGSSWTSVGHLLNGRVRCLAVFDDGAGPALYAGGEFVNTGLVVLNGIAKWEGASWAPVGGGLGGDASNRPWVTTLTAFADVSGARARKQGSSTISHGKPLRGMVLYAGGSFTSAGGVAAQHVAMWDGSSWSPLGGGIDGTVSCSAVFADGNGPALYVGGNFTAAGGVAASDLARWDGRNWSSPGSGLNSTSNDYTGVDALAVLDDGRGPALFAAGGFTAADGVPAKHIARWDGAGWSTLGDGLHAVANALQEFDDGRGPALFVGGAFSTAGNSQVDHIARWDGSSWSALGGGMSGGLGDILRNVAGLIVFGDGRGPALYACGHFTAAGGVPANHIARWDGASWSPLSSGLAGGRDTLPEGVLTRARPMAVFDDGSGPALYVGGDFTLAGGVPASNVARWDGASWSPLGSGISNGFFTAVHALAVFDDGSGPALYAGGDFTLAGGVPARNVARWDGASWSPLDSGVGGVFVPFVTALTAFDDGSGPALYVGGHFALAGDVEVNAIAKWDGSRWSPLGEGMQETGFPGGFPQVNALATFDDGGGPELYAGGYFLMADGLPVNGIARWSGSNWWPLGSGAGIGVVALAVFDSGRGADLYVGGGLAASDSGDSHLARWGCAAPAAIPSKTRRR